MDINDIIIALDTPSSQFKKKHIKSKTDYLTSINPELINSMPKELLYKLTKSLSITALSRRTKLERYLEENQDVPTANIFREGHKIDYKEEKLSPNRNMSIQKLRNLYIKQRNFLQAKSSTVKGLTEILEDFYSRITESVKTIHNVNDNSSGVRPLSREDYKKLWKVYSQIEEHFTGAGYDSNQIQSMVYEIVEEYGEYNDVEDLVQLVLENYSPEYMYELKKSKEIEDNGTEDFLSIGNK